MQIIDERQDELYELLSNLIKINSENFGSHGNEQECAEYIKNLCEGMGLQTELYTPLVIDDFENHPDYFPGRNLENRPNVTARWKGEADEDYLMLMAHSDTVRIGDPNNWTVDPLGGEIKDGKIWGRGTTDDKYGIATALRYPTERVVNMDCKDFEIWQCASGGMEAVISPTNICPLLRTNVTSRCTLIGSPEKSLDFLGKRQNKIANIVFARKRQLHILF